MKTMRMISIIAALILSTCMVNEAKAQNGKTGTNQTTAVPIPPGTKVTDSTAVKNPHNKISPAELPPVDPAPGFENVNDTMDKKTSPAKDRVPR